MKVGEFLSKCSKEQIPFYMYNGTGIGYKISCLECEFFKPNENGIYVCDSIFLSVCRDEFAEWLRDKDMPNEH